MWSVEWCEKMVKGPNFTNQMIKSLMEISLRMRTQSVSRSNKESTNDEDFKKFVPRWYGETMVVRRNAIHWIGFLLYTPAECFFFENIYFNACRYFNVRLEHVNGLAHETTNVRTHSKNVTLSTTNLLYI